MSTGSGSRMAATTCPRVVGRRRSDDLHPREVGVEAFEAMGVLGRELDAPAGGAPHDQGDDA